jgi:hypothetical protein
MSRRLSVLGSLVADPAPQQDLDFTVGRRDLEDATLRDDFAAAPRAPPPASHVTCSRLCRP